MFVDYELDFFIFCNFMIPTYAKKIKHMRLEVYFFDGLTKLYVGRIGPKLDP